MVLTQYSTKT